eukprot:SAG22_NODE_3025_length_2016_cov_1.142410_2_plen_90_part_00
MSVVWWHQVVVAGGKFGTGAWLRSAELWDPATGEWTSLPPMAHARVGAAGCMLPSSGKFAVVGGQDSEGEGKREANEVHTTPPPPCGQR